MVVSYKFLFKVPWIKNAKNLVKKQTLNNNLISWNTVSEGNIYIVQKNLDMNRMSIFVILN